MDELLALARAGAVAGTTLVAEYQTAGRGRTGRGWQAPPGTSLLLSVLLRPRLAPGELTPLALLTAACVAEAIEQTCGLQPRIKWPNDLLIRDRKVCGILASVSAASTSSPIVVLGIGLNVNVAAPDLPAEATSLLVERGQPSDRESLMATLLDRLGEMYRSFSGRQYGDWWGRASDRLAFVGETVVVRDQAREVRGVLTGVAPDGALCLRGEDGARHRIVVGDLVRGPRRAPRGGSSMVPLVPT